RAFILCVATLVPTSLVLGQNEHIDSGRVPDGIGVNVHFNNAESFPTDGELKLLVAAGFRWVRTDLTWQATDGKAGPDFAFYDRLAAKFDQFRLRTIFILCYRNSLWNQGNAFSTSKERQSYARWAAAAAQHFKGRGIYW